MTKLILYHGTTTQNAHKIKKEGFKTKGVKTNWKVKSKKGFVYFSTAYAPFFAMMNHKNTDKLAIIKVEVDTDNLYPDDDFLMLALGNATYTQKQLDALDFEKYKFAWGESLKYMGSVCCKPEHIKILGVTHFDGRQLVMVCDPVISPANFQFLGKYYEKMTQEIFSGVPVCKLTQLNAFL